jgi:transcriptional regulator with XRE-family HTH domain
MKPNIEIYERLISDRKSGWHKDARERYTNRTRNDKAFNIALKLLKYQEANNLNQNELAEKIGVSKQYINRILQGKENLTLRTIGKIEQALKISIIETDIYLCECEIDKSISMTSPQHIKYDENSLFKIGGLFKTEPYTYKYRPQIKIA